MFVSCVRASGRGEAVWVREVCPPKPDHSGTEKKGLRVIPFLEPEGRFLKEPARTDRLCASRLVQKNDTPARVLALAGWLGCMLAKARARRSFFVRAGSHRSTLSEPARLKNDAVARVFGASCMLGCLVAFSRARRSLFDRACSCRSTLSEPARLKNDAVARLLAKNVV